MRLQVLGCAGGIGGKQQLTTCFLLDHDILLDAGTGISTLDVQQLAAIDHVFLTHAHLDHVAGLAFLADTVLGKRHGPVTVHASEQVIDALKKHLFNWVLWPDFASIPDTENPVICWSPLRHGEPIEIDGRQISYFPVNHTEGSAAYWLHSGQSGLLFTGDMGSTPDLWSAFAKEEHLRQVIVDCSFPNAEAELAEKSRHFCPQALLADIVSMPETVEFLIYHLKPGQEDAIMHEIHSAVGVHSFKALQCGDVFQF